MAQASLVVEHVAARALVAGEIPLEDIAQRGAFHVAVGALDVALDVPREPDRRHETPTCYPALTDSDEATAFVISAVVARPPRSGVFTRSSPMTRSIACRMASCAA